MHNDTLIFSMPFTKLVEKLVSVAETFVTCKVFFLILTW